MELLISVLNNPEDVDDVIVEFENSGIHGATIIDSTGMANVLATCEESNLFGSLQLLLNQGRPSNKTIFTVLKSEQVDIAISAIKKVVGDLAKDGKGIVFTLPINRLEGGNF